MKLSKYLPQNQENLHTTTLQIQGAPKALIEKINALLEEAGATITTIEVTSTPPHRKLYNEDYNTPRATRVNIKADYICPH
jgi:hypothetical protein